MGVNREMSGKTMKQIDELLHKITWRAAEIKENEIHGYADLAIARLENLAMEIAMEDGTFGSASG